jgi:hypothetical protein
MDVNVEQSLMAASGGGVGVTAGQHEKQNPEVWGDPSTGSAKSDMFDFEE